MHQRLYELKKDQQIAQKLEKTELFAENRNEDSGFFTTRKPQVSCDLTFSPQISANSKILLQKKRENLLKNQENRSHCTCLGCRPAENRENCEKLFKLSQKSAAAFSQKFVREFQETLKEALNQENPKKLHFIELETVLTRLGFLQSEPPRSELLAVNKTATILKEIWSILQGKLRTWVSARNLLAFLLAVLNIFPDKSLVPASEDAQLMKESQSNTAKMVAEDEFPQKTYGRFGFYGDLELTPADVAEIHRDFNALFLNKLAQSKEITLFQEKTQSFSPAIGEASNSLAQAQKLRFLKEFGDNVSENCDFFQVSKLREAQKLQNLEELRGFAKEKEIESCTFVPAVSDFAEAEKKLHLSAFSKKSHDFCKTSPLSSGKTRFLELYSLQKPRTEKFDKSRDELEFEKNCENCTFKPDLAKSRLKPDLFEKKPVFSKGIEKTLERVQNARIEKKFVESLRENGLAFNEFRDKKLKEEIKRREEEKSLRISGVYAKNSGKSSKYSNNSSKFEKSQERNVANESGFYWFSVNLLRFFQGITQGSKQYSTIIPEDGVPTFGLRNEDDERIPLLFVDVNITEGRNARIVIYEGDNPEDLAEKFAEQYRNS